MKNKERLSTITLAIVGSILVIDVLLEQFFNIGTMPNSLIVVYICLFIILSSKFENISKKKIVIIPLYIMVLQTCYSLVKTYLL